MSINDTEISTLIEDISLEELISRHRREKKELQAKIQNLKKNAPKQDKKKRKEALEEILRLENDIEQRHTSELNAVKVEKVMANTVNVELNNANHFTNTNDESYKENVSQQRISKAQKRREKKEREARQRDEDFRNAAQDSIYEPKMTEARNFQVKLKERQLELQEIPSDGDCLYNAIRHQLLCHGLGSYTVASLRTECANYIRANKESLICYMTNPKTGQLLSDEEFNQYCINTTSTSSWGGQIELKALSSVLKLPIEVLQSEGPPTILGSDEFAGPNLTITYHRHMFSLGEHYNSTKEADDDNNESDS